MCGDAELRMSSNIELSIIVPIKISNYDLRKLEIWLSKIDENIEVILVWNGLINTEVKKRISQFKRKNIININELTLGPGSARNAGLNLVKGKWFTYCDVDDLIEPPVIIEVLKSNNSNSDMIIFNYDIFEKGTDQLLKMIKCENRTELAMQIGIWRIVFRSEIFVGLRFPNLIMAEDQIYLMKCEIDSKKVQFVDKVSYKYFINDSKQLTNNKNAKQAVYLAFFEAYEEIKKAPTDFNYHILVGLLFSTIKYSRLKNKLKAVMISCKLLFDFSSNIKILKKAVLITTMKLNMK